MSNHALPLASIIINGNDAEVFLQQFFTQDIRTNHPVYWGYFCNHQGKVLAMAAVVRHASGFRITTHQSTHHLLFAHLERYILTQDIRLSIDPQQWQACTKQLADSIPTFKDPFDTIIAPLNAAANPINPQRWIDLWLMNGCTWIDAHLSGRFLPGLLSLISTQLVCLSKGCYLGQEILARMHHKGRLKKRLIVHPKHLTVGQAATTDEGCGEVLASGAHVSLVLVPV